MLRPLGWLTAGMVAVSAAYGVVVALVGTAMPQFSTAASVPGELSGLQSLGNVVVLAVLLVVTGLLAGGRLGRWLTANPHRIAVVTASGLLVAGVFTVLYWDVRLLANRGIIPWYPIAPWA